MTSPGTGIKVLGNEGVDLMKNSPMTPFEFDTRMVEWNLKHGVVNKDAVEKYRKSLPDESANTEPLHIDDEGSDSQAGQ